MSIELAGVLALGGIGAVVLGFVLGARWSRRESVRRNPAGALPEIELDDPATFAPVFVETAHDVIYVISREGIFTYFNPVFEMQTGWTRDDWLQKPFWDLLHPDDLALVRDRFPRLLAGEVMPLARLRIRTRSGEYWIGEFKTIPLRRRGKVIGVLGIASDINQSQRLEAALRESQRFLTSIFESIQDGISILDNQLTILRVNPTMERWFAHMQPLVGKKCYEVYHNRNQPCEVCPSLRTLASGEASHEFVAKMGPNQQVVGTTELYTFPFTDSETGERRGVIEFVRDVTSRIRAEEALRESLQASADIARSLPAGLLVYQHQEPGRLRLLEANEAACRMLGCDLERDRGREFAELWPAGAALKPRFLEVLASRETFALDDVAYADRGPAARFNIRVFAMPADRLGVILEDVTQAKLAYESLHLAEEKYRHVVELSLVGIYIIQDMRFDYVNPRFAEIFGYSTEEIRALPSVFDLTIEEDRGMMAENIRKRLAGELQSIRYSFRGLRKDRTVIEVEVHGSVMEIGGRRVIIGTLLDTTEPRRLEEQLRQSQKMEAVGRLAGGVAHDFNNLLMAIMGYSELLLTRLPAESPHRREVEEIVKASQRGSALTRQLLAFSRRQMLQPIVLNLNAVLVSLKPMLAQLLGEDIQLAVEEDPELASIKADPGNMEQVIVNLAVNARDAMPEGGRLSLSTANLEVTGQESPPIAEAAPGRYVALTIEDSGIGMTAETVQRVFDPFFSTKEIGKGTGLGLAVVYGIVKQHEGAIQVSSRPGQGTTVRILLPVFASRGSAPRPESAPSDLRPGRGERILLVEDNQAVRELSVRALSDQGYVVFPAATAREGLQLFQTEEGRFNLVFSDVVLADRSGLRLVEDLRQLIPNLRVLLTSGYVDHKAQWPLIQSRGYAFLQKPYALHELLRAVQDLLALPS